MKIHFVTETEKQRWVLRYWAESLARELPYAAVGVRPDPCADWNVFTNYALYKQVGTKTAGIFTHREAEGPLRLRFDSVARSVDWCFAQCNITAHLLPPDKTSVLRMYPEGQFLKPLLLGIVGRPYKSGRKRFSWVSELQAIEGVEVLVARRLTFKEMPGFYDGIDYLVVTANNEGGPMPVLEAMARGRPVIAPNVGHCWELPVLRYSTKKDLLDLVRRLVIPWDGWAQSAHQLLETLQCLT